MKLSNFDFNKAKALFYLLEEAHVGKAAACLGITPAAASNALRRLREEFSDPLLVKEGRTMVRTRVGHNLRAAARDVITNMNALLRTASPFLPAEYCGQLPIAMAEHVAGVFLPHLDRVVSASAPNATLAIAAIPLSIGEWLEQTAGVLVAPSGAFAVSGDLPAPEVEPFYRDRYVCLMRRGHPSDRAAWNVAAFAAQEHILVLPRGKTQFSDIDEHLAKLGLARRIARVVPTFSLALPLVKTSNLIVSVPAICVESMGLAHVTRKKLPIELPPLDMTLLIHPAHAHDGRVAFMKQALRKALGDIKKAQGLSEDIDGAVAKAST